MNPEQFETLTEYLNSIVALLEKIFDEIDNIGSKYSEAPVELNRIRRLIERKS